MTSLIFRLPPNAGHITEYLLLEQTQSWLAKPQAITYFDLTNGVMGNLEPASYIADLIEAKFGSLTTTNLQGSYLALFAVLRETHPFSPMDESANNKSLAFTSRQTSLAPLSAKEAEDFWKMAPPMNPTYPERTLAMTMHKDSLNLRNLEPIIRELLRRSKLFSGAFQGLALSTQGALHKALAGARQ